MKRAYIMKRIAIGEMITPAYCRQTHTHTLSLGKLVLLEFFHCMQRHVS